MSQISRKPPDSRILVSSNPRMQFPLPSSSYLNRVCRNNMAMLAAVPVVSAPLDTNPRWFPLIERAESLGRSFFARDDFNWVMMSNELLYLIKNKIEIGTKEMVTKDSSKMIRWAKTWK
jgi:hypothetical protein